MTGGARCQVEKACFFATDSTSRVRDWDLGCEQRFLLSGRPRLRVMVVVLFTDFHVKFLVVAICQWP